VSSTSEDLGRYREAARTAVIQAECLPRAMEYFAASDTHLPLAACLKHVSASDVLIVIVAHRYGWVPVDQPGHLHKSITWLECERAVKEGKNVLAFIVDDSSEWPTQYGEAYGIVSAIENGNDAPEKLKVIQRNVDNLKRFKAWLQERGVISTFKTPDDLSTKILHALHHWKSERSTPRTSASKTSRTNRPEGASFGSTTAGTPFSNALNNYLRRLLLSTERIDVRGLQVGNGKANQVLLKRVFVSLTATIRPDVKPANAPAAITDTSGEELGFDEVAHSGAVSQPLEAALSRRRVVITGDPGSGKTTFLRHLGLELSETLLGLAMPSTVAMFHIEPRLPILIRLGDLAEHIRRSQRNQGGSGRRRSGAAFWLTHFLATTSEGADFKLDQAFFTRLMQKLPCLFMFDGLDEVSGSGARAKVSRFIEEVSAEYPQAQIIVTSRPGAHAGATVVKGFTQVQIEPLNDLAISEFLDRWCKALFPDDGEKAETHRRELLRALQSQAEVHRMASNPVMLTALAVVHWNERQSSGVVTMSVSVISLFRSFSLPRRSPACLTANSTASSRAL
jgi:hypothetical protein